MNTIIKSISDLKKLGLVHTPELDFADDGNHFKMFTYKGIPVSYLKNDDEYYLAVRFDYLENITYPAYRNFSGYEKSNDFNGTSAIPADDLKEILEECVQNLADYRAKPVETMSAFQRASALELHDKLAQFSEAYKLPATFTDSIWIACKLHAMNATNLNIDEA